VAGGERRRRVRVRCVSDAGGAGHRQPRRDRGTVFRRRCHCPRGAAGLANARRTWIHPCRVPHHRAGPGRTRARRRPRLCCAAGWRGRSPRSPVSTSAGRACGPVSSTSHCGCWPSSGARATICPLASQNRLMRRLLRTGLQPTQARGTGWVADFAGGYRLQRDDQPEEHEVPHQRAPCLPRNERPWTCSPGMMDRGAQHPDQRSCSAGSLASAQPGHASNGTRLAVDLPAMPDIDHDHQQDLVVDLVDDAVVADPNAPLSWPASFLHPAGRGSADRASIAARIFRRSGLSRLVTALAARRETSTRNVIPGRMRLLTRRSTGRRG